jgi:hypothetical protein
MVMYWFLLVDTFLYRRFCFLKVWICWQRYARISCFVCRARCCMDKILVFFVMFFINCNKDKYLTTTIERKTIQHPKNNLSFLVHHYPILCVLESRHFFVS